MFCGRQKNINLENKNKKWKLYVGEENIYAMKKEKKEQI